MISILPKTTASQSTQNFVPIKEIRNGVVVLKDNSIRAILMASSINLALKSEDEQTSVLLQFQNFLNSLDFSVQLLVQSRDLDIRPYIALLEEKYAVQTNDLMKVQTREYIEFIKAFTQNSDIMTKSFFVVIPYTPAVIKSAVGIGGILSKRKRERNPSLDQDSFEENLTQLNQRISIVEQGLVRTGVRIIRLGTEELIELYYKIFNPGDLEKPIQLNH
jgi:type IV secretory pathway VirB4 component